MRPISQSWPLLPEAIRTESSGFARFCAVGAVGFLIDAGLLLWFISAFDLNPYAARALSVVLALSMTWAMHRNWTFKSEDSGRFTEWSRFAMVNAVGATINYLVYVGLLVAIAGLLPLLALIAGSAVALVANFLGSRLWAFRSGNAKLS